MLRVILIAFGGLVVLVVLVVAWRIIATKRATRRRTATVMRRLEPVLAALRADGPVPMRDIERFAATPELRNMLYASLLELKKADLFPDRYRRRQAIAESDLTLWLCHGNELGTPPDEMELVTVSSRETGTGAGAVDYYVFRYRTHPPHWAASDGWMLGVAGPYGTAACTDVPAPGTFSTFKSENAITPEQHVDFCHRHMTRRGFEPRVGS